LQINLQDAAAQVSTHQIGASATIQAMPVGELMGEFVAGHWAEVEDTSSAKTQRLQWAEGGKYGRAYLGRYCRAGRGCCRAAARSRRDKFRSGGGRGHFNFVQRGRSAYKRDFL